MYPETVEIINVNPEKSMSVNVTGDSNYALVCDVMKKLFGLDYAREEEVEKPKDRYKTTWERIFDMKSLGDLANFIEGCPHDFIENWYIGEMDSDSIEVVHKYHDFNKDKTVTESKEVFFDQFFAEDGKTVEYWNFEIHMATINSEDKHITNAPTARTAVKFANDLLDDLKHDYQIERVWVVYQTWGDQPESPLNGQIFFDEKGF